MRVSGLLLRCSGLRIWYCHCSSLGGCCGPGLIPDPGTSTCHGYIQKIKNKKGGGGFYFLENIELIVGSCFFILSDNLFFFFFFFGHICGMWKFPGQGSNPCHSSNPSHCSENARSLTCCTHKRTPQFDNLYFKWSV